MKKILFGLALAGSMSLGSVAHAAPISYMGGTYSENFDSLPTTGTTTNTVASGAAGPFEVPGSTGFQYARTSDSTAATFNFVADAGTATGGAAYSYGSAGSTDRALGSLASGTNIPFFGVGFTNNSGQAITQLTVTYTGEQWRNGGNATAQKLDFQYRVGGTSSDNITTITTPYNDVDALDFTSPTVGATAAALNGNLAANQSMLSNTFNVNIAVGDTFFFRWNDANDAGNDHGLAVDNFSFSANSVMATPEPETWAMMALGVGALAMFSWKRKRNAEEASFGGGFAI